MTPSLIFAVFFVLFLFFMTCLLTSAVASDALSLFCLCVCQ
uniref:Uncharacterized protein n=1 Tax=Arundo donax TaxID=35708 RepID=A0A0A9FEA1_ARUDO